MLDPLFPVHQYVKDGYTRSSQEESKGATGFTDEAVNVVKVRLLDDRLVGRQKVHADTSWILVAQVENVKYPIPTEDVKVFIRTWRKATLEDEGFKD